MIYSTDINDIFNAISKNKCACSDVIRISSKNPLTLSDINRFNNVQCIRSIVIINPTQFDAFKGYLLTSKYLTHINVAIMLDNNVVTPTNARKSTKRPRMITLTPYENFILHKIPELLECLKLRLQNMTFSVYVNDNTQHRISTHYDKGSLIVLDENNESSKLCNSVIQKFFDFNAVTKFTLNSDCIVNNYNSKVLSDLIIIPSYSYDIDTLTNLVLKTTCVTINYTKELFKLHTHFSDLIIIIFDGIVSKNLTRLCMIVPLIDVDTHILQHPYLREIHVLVENKFDVDTLIEIMKYHSREERVIFYTVYYMPSAKDKYWTTLIKYAEVKFIDLLEYLND